MDKSVMGGIVAGDHDSYMMIQKHTHYEYDMKEGRDIIVIDSFDGTEHTESKKKLKHSHTAAVVREQPGMCSRTSTGRVCSEQIPAANL
eukprot:12221517-Ditylum_brightwellii.AAC.1